MTTPLEQRIPSCSEIDVLRYRYHHGCNVGGIFVAERWLFPSTFPPDAAPDQTSELSCVASDVERVGLEKTKSVFEDRWLHAITEDDLYWLSKEAHC